MKLLAVCGFGVGSSMVLKMSIEKACKERGVECEVENTDVSSAKGTDADAVFTSFELGEELKSSVKCPVFSIKRYMDKAEVGQAVDAFLEQR
ncbi:PTS system, ascorbate-specific IIB component [Amphibacillus marinus]|uniref:PTS system, ascorbate-specific IIB component n=1 Tax=Amphibacillus marinus TaxID=872970 RepID=A0A1H8QTS1_9BACI|nr:PTS sugar transporter subunit IIB [Amphibacillus marinus]SEO57264.1 PTS system, ascorbate-specific IIB component [Amphibacillus marinus]